MDTTDFCPMNQNEYYKKEDKKGNKLLFFID